MRGALRVIGHPDYAAFPLALWLGEGRVAPAWLAALLLLGGLARLPASANRGGALLDRCLRSCWRFAVLVRRFVAAKILSGTG